MYKDKAVSLEVLDTGRSNLPSSQTSTSHVGYDEGGAVLRHEMSGKTHERPRKHAYSAVFIFLVAAVAAFLIVNCLRAIRAKSKGAARSLADRFTRPGCRASWIEPMMTSTDDDDGDSEPPSEPERLRGYDNEGFEDSGSEDLGASGESAAVTGKSPTTEGTEAEQFEELIIVEDGDESEDSALVSTENPKAQVQRQLSRGPSADAVYNMEYLDRHNIFLESPTAKHAVMALFLGSLAVATVIIILYVINELIEHSKKTTNSTHNPSR